MSFKGTNPQLQEAISQLRRISRKNKAKIWETVADLLCKPKRSRVAVNVGQIARHVSNGDIIVVPGRVLASGTIASKVTIAAHRFSDQAEGKIEKAGGKCLSLLELAEKYPKGSGVRIMR